MTDINSISNPVPTSPPSAPAEAAAVRAKEQTRPTPPPAPEVEDQGPRFSIPNYTVRYHVQGHQVSVRILDDEGRLVRTVPSSELLKALKQDALSPRVNFLG